MADDETTLETPGLDRLIRALKIDPPTIRVGILGSHSARDSTKGNGPSNAEIGAAHEFGTSKLPIRSFLRVPLTDHLADEMENSNAFSPETLAKVIASGSIKAWADKIGDLAESIVLQAFDSSGYGKWPASDMTHKKVKQTLVESQQLRNSITSEVKE